MKRILLTAVREEGGIHWFEGAPFSGIGYTREPDDRVRADVLRDGRIESTYQPLTACGREVPLQIDITQKNASGNYERQYYHDRLFTGVGYEFSGIYCTRETYFVEGNEDNYAQWDFAGNPVEYVLGAEEFAEGYAWYSNGQLEKISVTTNSSFAMWVRFSQSGALQYLALVRYATANFAKISAASSVFPFQSLSDLGKLRGDSKVTLDGDDINDDLLRVMVRCGTFDETRELVLNQASVSDFQLLLGLPRLQVLKLNELAPEKVDSARSLAKARPTLSVVVNGTVVQ